MYTAVKTLLTAGWDIYNRVGETSISRTSCTIVWYLRMVRNCWDPEVDWKTDRFHDLRLLQDQRRTSVSRWHERLAEFYVRPSRGRDTDGRGFLEGLYCGQLEKSTILKDAMALYHSEALAGLGLQESESEVAEHFREYKGRNVLQRTTDTKQCSQGKSQAASILLEHDLQALHGMTGEANDRFPPSEERKVGIQSDNQLFFLSEICTVILS